MSHAPRVALFLPSLGGGGAERNVARLASGLSRVGRAVDLVVGDARGPAVPGIDPGVRVVDLGAPRVLRAVRPLATYLARERPAVLISAHEHANVAALLARRWSGARLPIVATIRSTLSLQAQGAPDWRDRWALPHLARWLYPGAERLVALSLGAARDAERWLGIGAGGVTVIPNPVVSDRLLAAANEPLDHPVFAEGRPPVILAVGRLAPEKDYPTLIDALRRLHRDGVRAQLVILGDGPLRAALGDMARGLDLDRAVTFAGFQPNPLPWMRRAQVVAHASRYEGLPTVLIEALACGARVVATDCPSGPREILGGGRWGTLVPVGDPAAMAAGLAAALTAGRPDVAPEDALAPYTEERVTAQYDQLIASVTGTAG